MDTKPIILVIDDTPKNIQLVANVLSKLDKYNILFATNGKSALERVQERKVSLILLDIMMPEMDGFEVAQKLKMDSKTKDIPIIFLTAFTDTDNIKKGFELGAADYITKPFNPAELIARVNTHLDLFDNKQRLKNMLFENTALLEQYKKVVDESEIVSKTDTRGRITYVNKKFLEISGFEEYELIGEPHNVVRHPDMPKEAFKEMWETITAKKIWQGEVKNLRKDGSTYVVNSTVMPILDVNGNIIEYMSLRHDITDIYELSKEVEDTQREVIFKLGAIGESRSKETGNHVRRVAEYSYSLAKLYGLSEKECVLLKEASPMHDIGKVAIPDSILNKPGKLTPEEFEIMKTHAKIGYEMLNHSTRPLIKTAAIVAYDHHERWDGTGYPKGIEKEEIHVFGRITAIADVFDALGSDRCYKKAWELDRILDLIKEESGKYFEPRLVDLFLENLDEFLKIRDKYKDMN